MARVFISIFICALFITNIAYANDMTIGSIAANIVKSMADLAKLITASAYVTGFGFAVSAILKFKAHKDNPTQNTIGAPIVLLFIAAALIFLPSVYGVAGQTIFGTKASTGTVRGVSGFD